MTYNYTFKDKDTGQEVVIQAPDVEGANLRAQNINRNLRIQLPEPPKPLWTATERQTFVDNMTYDCYRDNRKRSPDISPESWGKIFSNVEALEARFQKEVANG